MRRIRPLFRHHFFLGWIASLPCLLHAQDFDPPEVPALLTRPDTIPSFFEDHATRLRESRIAVPEDPADLPGWRARLLERHARALGVPLEHVPSPVPYETVGDLKREGYKLKKILFESRPGVPVTAHLYLPDRGTQPAPGILCVHGHWPGAKNAVQVHSRCVFLALRGFVVLSVDALGAGERAYRGIAYHGRQLGYHPFIAGTSLAGLQVMENRRALDLLSSLPEVDPESLGVTGASGGGNQTFHLAILDPRVRAAVGVCFFGSYHGYLRGAHCACETVPGVLTYADEGELAGLIAPRSLMILAAKEDSGAAFRIEDARKQAEVAGRAFAMAGVSDRFEFVEFEGGHDYSQSMRETMVAFFEKRLMNRDSGPIVPEPELDLLDSEALRVLDGNSFPEGTLFAPQIVVEESARLAGRFAEGQVDWKDPEKRSALRAHFIEEVFGGFPEEGPIEVVSSAEPNALRIGVEPGVEVDLVIVKSTKAPKKILLIVGETADPIPEHLPEETMVARLFPRGTGPTEWPAANTVDCEDYLLAQGSIVLGRPMMGQWVWDILRTVDHLRKDSVHAETTVYGQGVMGWAVILAAALDDRIDSVVAADILSSHLWPDRFDDRWGLVHFLPGLAKYGDIQHIAAGIHPRPLQLIRLRDGGGEIKN